jgi:hypothetical protein
MAQDSSGNYYDANTFEFTVPNTDSYLTQKIGATYPLRIKSNADLRLEANALDAQGKPYGVYLKINPDAPQGPGSSAGATVAAFIDPNGNLDMKGDLWILGDGEELVSGSNILVEAKSLPDGSGGTINFVTCRTLVLCSNYNEYGASDRATLEIQMGDEHVLLITSAQTVTRKALECKQVGWANNNHGMGTKVTTDALGSLPSTAPAGSIWFYDTAASRKLYWKDHSGWHEAAMTDS